jgi:phosphate transport system protein
MAKHLQREIEKLKKHIMTLGTLVETAVYQSVDSVVRKDKALAEQIIKNDIKIDDKEVEIEEECLKTLALYQPVAVDLRFIVAVLKINNDLERIGDLAVNIAERSAFLADKKVDVILDFGDMAQKVQAMLKGTLDSLVDFDRDLADSVRTKDDQVDSINRDMYIKVQDAIKKNPEQMQQLIHLLSVSRHLERIADHATNIAEDVIYMIDGEIVRHTTESY